MISDIEKGYFVKLFNRDGYVLDFSTANFDAFTMASIGVPLCSHYEMSKGRSFETYIHEADENDALKLLVDLLEYYEAHYRPEFDETEKESFDRTKHAKGNKGLYLKCREIIDRETQRCDPLSPSASYLKDKFSSPYMNSQIDLLLKMRTENPTEAIGKSRELIESCCKTILENLGIEFGKNWDATKLLKETEKALGISAGDVGSGSPESEHVRKILGSLHGIAVGVVEFRNAYGSGHGKSASFKPLPPRHAKLAVGSSITLVEYLWETYEWRQSQKASS